MTKKKLVITITSLCLVVVAAVAAVVGILAATKVTLNSNFNVKYTPSAHVIAKVTGRYQEEGKTAVSFVTQAFNYGEETNTAKIQSASSDSETIELNDTNKYVVIEFVFENTAVEGNTNSQVLTVEMTDNSKKATDHMSYDIFTTTTALANLTKDNFTTGKANKADNALAAINYGSKAYVYVLVERTEGIEGSWGTVAGKTNTYEFALSAAKASA